jgi:SNF2 family DNA or RNA helicase
MLTGTPVHNRETDLNAYWLLLGVSADIISRIYSDRRDILKALIASRITRRTKDDIGLRLPPLITEDIDVPWDDELEADFAAELHAPVTFADSQRERISPCSRFLTSNHLAALVRCRQICSLHSTMDPHIRFFADYSGTKVTTPPAGSAKTRALVKHIIRFSQPGNHSGRKIVFCHFSAEIDFIRHALSSRRLSVDVLDGRVPTHRRDAILAAHLDVLILQIRANAEGLNLHMFSHVYILSPNWNPAIDAQAVARAHRFRQTRDVRLTRFRMLPPPASSLSLDHHALLVQARKRDLATNLAL